MLTETYNMAVNLTALLTFINTQILAADDAGFFKLGGDNSCMGGLTAAGSQQTMGLGNFLDVLRNRVLPDQDQGAIRVFLA